jgi:hypothetical protein
MSELSCCIYIPSPWEPTGEPDGGRLATVRCNKAYLLHLECDIMSHSALVGCNAAFVVIRLNGIAMRRYC